MTAMNPESFPHIARAQGDYQIDVFELNERIEAGNAPVLVDVRRSHELELCKLDNIIHVPMETMESSWQESLDDKKDEEIVVICRTGKRSEACRAFLKGLGFNKVRNFVGGMHAWAEVVDTSMPKY